jgi:UDP-sulfoquinovose synthase
LPERLLAFRQQTGRDVLEAREIDVATADIDELIETERPDLVYHLAQMCSAPHSMTNVEQAVETIQNNEIGNMRLLWAIRRHAPNTHLVKLGTFGEYAKGGIDIAEGSFLPSWRGKTATRPLPYPRESDDVYHTSKINDSNYLSLACRKWGLRATDIMQSTIFGVDTPATASNPAFVTRFDYDGVWGTVVNRFIAQTVVGLPMTVYGTGLQRSGLMALSDSVSSLAHLAARRPERGEYRVINNVTERRWCVLEIAEQVAEAAKQCGYNPVISRGEHNPRGENETAKAEYGIDADFVSSCVSHTPFPEAVKHLFAVVAQNHQRVRREVMAPAVSWS